MKTILSFLPLAHSLQSLDYSEFLRIKRKINRGHTQKHTDVFKTKADINNETYSTIKKRLITHV